MKISKIRKLLHEAKTREKLIEMFDEGEVHSRRAFQATQDAAGHVSNEDEIRVYDAHKEAAEAHEHAIPRTPDEYLQHVHLLFADAHRAAANYHRDSFLSPSLKGRR